MLVIKTHLNHRLPDCLKIAKNNNEEVSKIKLGLENRLNGLKSPTGTRIKEGVYTFEFLCLLAPPSRQALNELVDDLEAFANLPDMTE